MSIRETGETGANPSREPSSRLEAASFLNIPPRTEAREAAAAPSDETLMEAVARGDKAAFSELIHRHLKRVIGVASRMLGSRGDGEEVAQEAFIRVWSCAPRWRPIDNGRGAPFRTWLYRIVLNLVIDRKRQRVMSPLDEVFEPVDESDNGFDRLYNAEMAALVTAAVSRLPERQRAVLVMCFFEGRTNVEAGKLLSLTVSAVESLLVRARRALREELGGAYRELSAG
jgi:RNA polymerase sigma-70 factor (ECF subfamily)